MILLTDEATLLETPLHYFREDFTPNEAIFVRWYFAGIPPEVNLAGWRLDVTGVGKPTVAVVVGPNALSRTGELADAGIESRSHSSES
jgi:hypothetical protein